MYLEGKKRLRFLLSAKQIIRSGSGTFLISTHESYPSLDPPPATGHIGRLEQQADRSFLLSLNFCHLCDQKFGYFTCGRFAREREVLAKVALSSRRYSIAGTSHRIEYRTVDVSLPAISKSGKRKVWCPRAFRASNPSITIDVDVNTALQMDRKMSQLFVSQAPEWNADVQTLVVKFHGDRVVLPSTKNTLLLPADKDAHSSSSSQSAASPTFSPYSGSGGQQIYKQGAQQSGSLPPTPHLTPHSPKKALLQKPSTSTSTPTVAPAASASAMMSGAMSVISEGSTQGAPPAPGSPVPAARRKESRSPVREDGNSLGSALDDTTAGIAVPREPLEGLAKESSSRSSSRSGREKSSKERSSRDKEKSRDKDKDRDRDREKDKDKEKKREKQRMTSEAPLDPETQEIHNRAVFQFGKTSHTKYSLDFKFPLSPIQAFGIALSTFGSERSPSGSSSVVSDYSGSTDNSSR